MDAYFWNSHFVRKLILVLFKLLLLLISITHSQMQLWYSNYSFSAILHLICSTFYNHLWTEAIHNKNVYSSVMFLAGIMKKFKGPAMLIYPLWNWELGGRTSPSALGQLWEARKAESKAEFRELSQQTLSLLSGQQRYIRGDMWEQKWDFLLSLHWGL